MSTPASSSAAEVLEHEKHEAAERAVEFVESGMVVGLGEGSTAIFAVRRIAELMQQGRLRNIVGIPCSRHIEDAARHLGIPISTLEEHAAIDLTIDGADEVDPDLNLINGGGGALLHEKIVAQASRRKVIIVADGQPFTTDEGDLILDCDLGPIRIHSDSRVHLTRVPASWSTVCSSAWRPTS
jgi:ribose 5-phosphate isomerase